MSIRISYIKKLKPATKLAFNKGCNAERILRQIIDEVFNHFLSLPFAASFRNKF